MMKQKLNENNVNFETVFIYLIHKIKMNTFTVKVFATYHHQVDLAAAKSVLFIIFIVESVVLLKKCISSCFENGNFN